MNNNLSIRIGILTASLCLFSCDDPPPSNPGPSAEMSSQAKLAADMNKMVRAQALSMTEAEQRGVTLTDTNAIAEYVDVLLSKKMSAGLAKGFFFGGAQGVKNRHPIPAYSNLKAIKTDQGVTYALRKPCNEDEAIEVTAWWTNKAVSVCPDVVRPEVIGDDQGRTCGASVLNPATTDICGCGPRLMWCTPNDKVRNALKMSLQVEVDKTVAKIVNDNMPVETLFTSNSTVRGRVAEFVYRRARVAAGEDPELLDLTDFPEEGEYWKERHEQVPGHHAGILTAPAVIYGSDALRGVMRNYFQYLWCASPSGSGVTTQGVLDLEVVDLRVGDGWKQLAHMDICTDCHARMDYSMQFFNGYPSSTLGVDFNPDKSLVGKQMKFYADDIKDQRGEGQANPLGFAKLALAQPEFGECLSRRVVDHVFHGTHSAEDFQAVQDTFEGTHRLKEMLRTALVRYATNVISTPQNATSSVEAATPPTTATVGTSVQIPATLRRNIDNRCIECHDEGDRLEFHHDSLPTRQVLQMAELVGFGVMPKTAAGMPDAERRTFVDNATGAVFSDPDERAAAMDYFINGMAGHPVHRFHTSAASIAQRAGAEKNATQIRVVETAVPQSRMTYTPTMSISSGVLALEYCKTANAKDLSACIEHATSPETLVVGNL